jgi:ribulose-phosphate 3-epimerase
MRMRFSRQSLGDRSPHILPSLLLCDFGRFADEIRRLEDAGATAMHLDVMDGNFVPNLTYGMPLVAAARKATDLPLDVHLMIRRPGDFITQFAEAGADCLTIHIEADGDTREDLGRIRELGMSAGLALNPETPLGRGEPYFSACDLLLVMSVSPGFGNQRFQRIALDKLRRLERVGSENGPLLEVDGGVNLDTVMDCTSAGAELLVIGSAIFKETKYGPAIQRLREKAAAGLKPVK